MRRAETAMWTALGLIAWTHLGYPAAVGVAARGRSRPRPQEAPLPAVTLVIAAHDEEAVIAARLENALALDYPRELLEVVVSLDGSSDRTAEIASAYEGVTVLSNPRGGKVAAQNAAVRATSSDLVAFSDANSMWEPGALRALVRHFADPSVGYVCGRLRLVDPVSGVNVEGTYWRYELWLRERESVLGSVTAGNGAIYAVRRSAYLELPPEHSHDIAFPFRLRRAGRRSLYEPEAVAVEPAAATSSAEWGRKVRMLSRSWHDLLRGGMLDPRGLPAPYVVALLSHRVLRYATGVLHLVLGATVAVPRSWAARMVAAGHITWLALAAAGRRGTGGPLGALAWYYLVVTAASAAGLWRALTTGPQVTWTAAEGTR